TVDLGALVAANETLTSLTYNPVNHTLVYTDESGVAQPALDLNAGRMYLNITADKIMYDAADGYNQEIDIAQLVKDHESDNQQLQAFHIVDNNLVIVLEDGGSIGIPIS